MEDGVYNTCTVWAFFGGGGEAGTLLRKLDDPRSKSRNTSSSSFGLLRLCNSKGVRIGVMALRVNGKGICGVECVDDSGLTLFDGCRLWNPSNVED
jgi:hypothetical protein